MKVLSLFILCVSSMLAQVLVATVKVDTDDDPAYAALSPKPVFDGAVTIRLLPQPGAVLTSLEITIASLTPGRLPLVFKGDVATQSGTAPDGTPLWGSIQLAIPSGFKIDMAGIVVMARSPLPAPVVIHPIAVIR